MATLKPADRKLSAGARSLHGGAMVLVALVLLLFALSYVQNRSTPAQERSDVAGQALDNLLLARRVYAILHSDLPRTSALDSLSASLIAGHRKAALADPSPASIRRLALCYYLLGDRRWKQAILRLETAPEAHPVMSAERELALWNAVLDGKPSTAQLSEFEMAVRKMDLGWYSHIALEAAYTRVGFTAEAAAEARQANRSSGRLTALTLVESIVGIFGLGIWAFLAARYLLARGQYRPAVSSIDRLLTPRAPFPLTAAQRGLLYYLFLSYLASVALIRLAIDLSGLGALLTAAVKSNPIAAILLSMSISVLPVITPCILFLRIARPAYVDWRAIGFCTSSWKLDVVCGIAGYAVALPLVAAARLLSETLFRGIETPTNPAILAFAGTDSALFQLLVFIQAALLAPLIEETLFRGVFFQSMEHRLGTWRSALLASAIFAILHPQLPLGFLGIFVLGMVFNMLFALRRSLLPCFVAHGINNAVILLLLLTLIRG